ncbi:MAG TPA: sulfur carrier protein ThiS [Microlunatus sp.]
MLIFVNGRQREVEPGARLSEVVVRDGETQPPRGVAVAVDGAVVPRARLAETVLTEGSRVEIVTAVQGG